MRQQNVRCRMFGEIGVNRSAVHSVSARRISAVGPINESILSVELEIDWLRQTIEQKLDVGAGGRGLTFRNIDVRTEDAALARVVGTFLRPVNLSTIRIDRDPDAPFRQVGAWTRVALAGVDQSLDV